MRSSRWPRYALETVLLGGLALGLRLLPRRAAAGVGRQLGGLYGHVDRRHRAVAARNLDAAFGEALAPAERRRILRETWRNFGRTAAENLVLDRYGPEDVDRVVTYDGWEHIAGAYAKGRGVLLFSAHFGNWELVARLQGSRGLPLDLVTRELENPFLERLLRARRTSSGNRVHHKRAAVRGMLRSLREGRGVAIVIDQNVRSGSRVFVPFLGRLAATTPALALVALRTGAPVVPVFAVPQPGARYRVVYLPEVPVSRTGDRARDVLALTAACTAIIERFVRRHPECWLWMHDRWKSRPRPGEIAATGAQALAG